MASAGPTNSINDRAAEWAVETAYGDLTPDARADLETWLAADSRHRGAYMRACAWLRATEDRVVAVGAATAPRPPTLWATTAHNDGPNGNAQALPVAHRRRCGRTVGAGAALAASVAALIVVGLPLLGPSGAPRSSTARNVMTLNDGTVATLGQNAQIDVAMTDEVRRITLLRGEVSFRVAHDKARPFVVRSGEVYAQATGTVYSVSRVDDTGGTVKVTQGSVLVWPRDERDQAVLLHAGGTVTLDPGPNRPVRKPAASAPPRLPPPDLAQISLDDVTVSSAVARFNRVNSVKIVVADPRIGNTRIIGLYRANDPEQFSKAVAAISGGYVEQNGGEIVIRSK
ncbi:FecR family protein [soil metagenome]